MAKNSSTEGGTEALDKALTKDHVSSDVLDNAEATTSGFTLEDGAKILNHVFGNDMTAVSAAVSDKAGIDAIKITQVLAFLALLIMYYLAKKKVGDNLNSGGLPEILTKQTSSEDTSLIDIVDSVIGSFSNKR